MNGECFSVALKVDFSVLFAVKFFATKTERLKGARRGDDELQMNNA